MISAVVATGFGSIDQVHYLAVDHPDPRLAGSAEVDSRRIEEAIRLLQV